MYIVYNDQSLFYVRILILIIAIIIRAGFSLSKIDITFSNLLLNTESLK